MKYRIYVFTIILYKTYFLNKKFNYLNEQYLTGNYSPARRICFVIDLANANAGGTSFYFISGF